jgi:DNA-binding LacI/PurR family transcriptional regulator
VSVVGFDDIFASSLCTPTLTTLGGAYAEVGRAAVEVLLQISNQPTRAEPAAQIALPAELVIRDSTGMATG